MEAAITKLPPNVTVYEGRKKFKGELPERVKKSIEATEVNAGKKPAKLSTTLSKAAEKLKAEKAAKKKPEIGSLPSPPVTGSILADKSASATGVDTGKR